MRKIIFLVMVATVLSTTAFAATQQDLKKAFSKKLWKSYKTSPYTKYAKSYKKLYMTGQISEAQYNDKMMEIETLEMNRRRETTNALVNYGAARRQSYNNERIAESLDDLVTTARS